MAEFTDRSDHFASLFEAITGQSTITERQQDEIVRVDEEDEGRAISAYINTIHSATGLDDVIDDPEYR